jgi:hypothetical protein
MGPVVASVSADKVSEAAECGKQYSARIARKGTHWHRTMPLTLEDNKTRLALAGVALR